jgi:hypothetical protein
LFQHQYGFVAAGRQQAVDVYLARRRGSHLRNLPQIFDDFCVLRLQRFRHPERFSQLGPALVACNLAKPQQRGQPELKSRHRHLPCALAEAAASAMQR